MFCETSADISEYLRYDDVGINITRNPEILLEDFRDCTNSLLITSNYYSFSLSLSLARSLAAARLGEPLFRADIWVFFSLF